MARTKGSKNKNSGIDTVCMSLSQEERIQAIANMLVDRIQEELKDYDYSDLEALKDADSGIQAA